MQVHYIPSRVHTHVHYIPSRVHTQVHYIPSHIYTQIHYIPSSVYTQVHYIQRHVYRTQTLSRKERCVHVRKLSYGFVVFGTMVLDLGIASEVLNPGIGSLVLVLNGLDHAIE